MLFAFQKINSFKPQTPLGKKLNEKLSTELTNKFDCIEAVKMYATATILDPRFKNQGFSNIRDASNAISHVGRYFK